LVEWDYACGLWENEGFEAMGDDGPEDRTGSSQDLGDRVIPKLFRAMKRDQDKPRLGSNATSLGVRVPQDINPDGNGNVWPSGQGMSVCPTPMDIPMEFFPERKRREYNRPGARGKGTFIWSMGSGPFVPAPIATELQLRPDRPGHGVVEPSYRMTFVAYQQALVDTQIHWSIDEK
jgi:hypothetical protein